MENRSDVRDIVGAVTTLAHQLGLEVIAEGVETDGQLALVRSLGCEYVQGFVFSKPVDSERAVELLRTGVLPSPGVGRVAAQAPDPPPEESGPAREAASRRPRIPRALYVPAAAVITLALAGLVVRFTAQPPPSAPTSARAALKQAAPVAQAPRADPVSTPAAPFPPKTSAASTPGRGAAPAGVSATTPARPAAKPGAYSFPVVHKHALRGCRGQLAVSSAGVAFVPDREEDKAKDGFTFKYSEFLYAVSGDELTVKSNARTYRFRAADTNGKDDGRARLQEIGDRMSSLQPASPAK